MFDTDDECVVDLDLVGGRELQVERLGLVAQQLGQHLPGRLALGVAVAVLLDDGGVDAQRDVVDEEAVAHRAVVDEALDAVAKGDHALARVFLVEAQVLGEVVARPGRDADERDVVLMADRGDEGLRPVAAGHAQAVGSAGDGVAGQNGKVEAVVEEDRLDAHLGGDLRQAELRHLAASRPWVAQEHRLARAHVAHVPQPVELAKVGCERRAPGERRDGQRSAGGGDPHERALGARTTWTMATTIRAAPATSPETRSPGAAGAR